MKETHLSAYKFTFFFIHFKRKSVFICTNRGIFFCILSFASLWEVLRPLLRSRQSRQAMFSDEAQHILRRTAAYSPTDRSIFSDGPQHILPRSTVPSPSKHIAFSRSAFSKTSKSVLKNYFQGLKIYFQGLVIYFQGLIIYFQGLKIILLAA